MCETDTANDARHCGGCDSVCSDLCRQGSCLKPERLLEGNFRGSCTGLAFTTDQIYALSAAQDDSCELRALTQASHVATTLLDKLPSVRDLLVAAGRLYMIDSDSHVVSTAIAGGGELRDEGVQADLIVATERSLVRVYEGVLTQRNLRTGTDAAPQTLNGAASVQMAAAGTSGIITFGLQATDSYELVQWDESGDVTTIASGKGSLLRLRAAMGDVFALVERTPGDCAVIGYGNNTTYREGLDIRDIATNGSALYLTYGGSTQGYLEYIPVANPSYRLVVGMNFVLDVIDIDAKGLFYVQDIRPGLYRVGLGTLLGN